jgi:hypothetical protein
VNTRSMRSKSRPTSIAKVGARPSPSPKKARTKPNKKAGQSAKKSSQKQKKEEGYTE